MLTRESEAAIEEYLLPNIDMDLASFVRCTTFRVFSVVFLGVDPGTLAFPTLQLVTGAVSDFYDDGQGKSTLPLEVQNILCEWLPCEFPFALDHILPAYEALWRIIATTMVTCEDDETKVLRWVMLDFRDNPRDRQYRVCFGNVGESVSAIMDDAVKRITPIARPQHATTSTWPLSCIQYASPQGSSMVGHPPTIQEALKFAALLASKIIGRIGVHYGISGERVMGCHAAPWEQRKIFGVNRVQAQAQAPGHVAIDVVDIPRPHCNAHTSRHH